jgi:FAD-dependent monooxygenase
MNTGLGDAFDLGWKLAAVLNGHGGEPLLESYEAERRPVAIRNVDMSGVHANVHFQYVNWVKEEKPGVVVSRAEEGKALRERIRAHVLANDGENQDAGIEMGYRHNWSPVVLPSKTLDGRLETEPEWNVRGYIPSTWPGARAPHVFLADGKTSIHDLFEPGYTLVDFTAKGEFASEFSAVASRLGVPLVVVRLPDERHARHVWGRNVVLVRPDDHVAWRAGPDVQFPSQIRVEEILLVATGRPASSDWLAAQSDRKHRASTEPTKIFTGTIGNVSQDPENIKLLAAFQK